MRSHVSQLADLIFSLCYHCLRPFSTWSLPHRIVSVFPQVVNIWVNGTEAISSYQFSFETEAGSGKTLGLRLVTLGSARLGRRERPEHWWQGHVEAMTEVAWPKSGLNWIELLSRRKRVNSIWHGDAGTTSKVQQLAFKDIFALNTFREAL